MQAEIIAIGDELVSGKILDTNSQWLSQELSSFGITVNYHTTVGDELESMVEVFRIAASRADLIVMTGGLGPTADDLTRKGIADMVGVPLEKHDELLTAIQAIFKRRGSPMAKGNESQAFLPKGAEPIHNPNGTAPGIDFTILRKNVTMMPKAEERLESFRILAFPGVPAEMREMWFDSGKTRIEDFLNQYREEKRVIRFRSINTFGRGESQVEAMLPDIVNRSHFPRVGITATGGTISLRIAAEGITEEECFRTMEPTAKLIYEILGDIIFSEGDDRLEDVICRYVKERQKTMAVIEAGTHGTLAAALAHSPESKNWFKGGLVLPICEPITVDVMIDKAHQIFDTDYLLMVGPYPEGKPDRNRREEVFVAVARLRRPGEQWLLDVHENYPFTGHPDLIDEVFCKRTMNLFRRSYLK